MSNWYSLDIMPTFSKDGARLMYWDTLHGHDVEIVIAPNGTVYEVIQGEDGEETPVEINLAERLLALCGELYEY